MPRFTIENNPITVAYGFDEATEVFLSVYDKRLESKEDANDEVNKVAKSVGIKDGGGSYLDLHTGQKGFGMKVSKETMRVYLARFGVPKKQIEELFGGKYSKNGQNSRVTEAVCDKCGCQKKWEHHELICGSLPFPVKTSKNSYYGILLPEIGERPILIEIPIKKEFDKYEKTYWDNPQFDEFLGKNKVSTRSYMPSNPIKPKRVMRDMLIMEYRDDFLCDPNCKSNQVIRKMTKGKCNHDWRGPVLVMKARGVELYPTQQYLDVQLSDFEDIVDFFMWYGSY